VAVQNTQANPATPKNLNQPLQPEKGSNAPRSTRQSPNKSETQGSTSKAQFKLTTERVNAS